MRYDLDYYSVDRMRDQLESLREKYDSIKENIDSRRIKEVFALFNEHYHQQIQEIDKSMQDQLLQGINFADIRLASRFLSYIYRVNNKCLKDTKRRVEEIYDYDQLNITGDFIESYDDMIGQIIDETFKQLANMTLAIDRAHQVILKQEKIDLEVLPEI